MRVTDCADDISHHNFLCFLVDTVRHRIGHISGYKCRARCFLLSSLNDRKPICETQDIAVLQALCSLLSALNAVKSGLQNAKRSDLPICCTLLVFCVPVLLWCLLIRLAGCSD
jgi:hypothetical protein